MLSLGSGGVENDTRLARKPKRLPPKSQCSAQANGPERGTSREQPPLQRRLPETRAPAESSSADNLDQTRMHTADWVSSQRTMMLHSSKPKPNRKSRHPRA